MLLCQSLYNLLMCVFGSVHVANRGRFSMVTAVIDPTTGRSRVKLSPSGESYCVNCPFCGDRKHKLWFHHLWNRYQAYVYCHRSQCLEGPQGQARRQQLRFRVFRAGPPSTAFPVLTGTAPPKVSEPITLPGQIIPVDQLEPDHPAAVYLAGRGHDPEELANLYHVGYCEKPAADYPAARKRLIIPVMMDGCMVTWQARRVGESDGRGWGGDGLEKYWRAPSSNATGVLYGFDAAKTWPYVVLCEGPTDVWRIGPPAVALLGKHLSGTQLERLTRTWSAGVVVLVLDGDAAVSSRGLAADLRRHFPGRVVEVALAPHEDPGSLTREEIWHRIRAAADAQGVVLPQREASAEAHRENHQHCEGAGTRRGAKRSTRSTRARLRESSKARLATPVILPDSTEPLAALLLDEGQRFVHDHIEQPLISVVESMHRHGVMLDVPLLEAVAPRVAMVKYDYETMPFQTPSSDQAGFAMILRYALEGDASARRPTRGLNPQAVSTYIESLWHHVMHPNQSLHCLHRFLEDLVPRVDPKTGRVHCQLDPFGAETGRFTCSEPAFHSFPRVLRDVVIASPDNLLIVADYSQIELRVLAQLSRDRHLRHVYRGNGDLHRQTAARVLGIAEEDVTKEQRDTVGKKVNFAITYGMTEHGLADALKISRSEAAAFLEEYRRMAPGAWRWAQGIQDQALRDGHVVTHYGRRRELPDVRSDSGALRGHALRQAVNTVVQGTAADINKLALIRLYKALEPGWKLLLTIHDAVLLEVPEKAARRAAKLVRTAMETLPPRFSVALPVDMHIGRSWGECMRSKPI